MPDVLIKREEKKYVRPTSAKNKVTPKFGLKRNSARPDSGKNHPLRLATNIQSLKDSQWTGTGLQVILSPSNNEYMEQLKKLKNNSSKTLMMSDIVIPQER